MKKDTLYTANRWNQNLFDWGGLAAADKAANPWNYADDLDTTNQYMNSSGNNWFGVSKKNNPFSKGNLQNTMGNMGTAVLGDLAYNLISDGYSIDGAGGAIVNGLQKFKTGDPRIDLAKDVFLSFGNRAFGTRVDKEALQAANSGTSYLSNYKSQADSFDQIKGPAAQANIGQVYKGGWFNKGNARKKNAALQEQRVAAQNFALNSVNNNIANLKNDQINNALANYAAFGGALDLMKFDRYMNTIDNRTAAIAKNNTLGSQSVPTYSSAYNNSYASGGDIHINPAHKGVFTSKANRAGMGVQEYASHVLANKDDYPTSTVRQANFARNAKGWRHDDGGGLDGAFLDTFSKDPMRAAQQYIAGLDALEASEAAAQEAAAQEKAFADMQLRLQNAETQNQGLQALMDAQARDLANMQQLQRESDALQSTPAPALTEGDIAAAESAMPTISEEDSYKRLKDNIRKTEGFMNKAYWLEGEAAPTIGYGFYNVYPGTNRKVKMGDTITREEAEKGLDVVIGNIEKSLSKKVPNWDKLAPNQRHALDRIAYGTGVNGAHFKKNSKMMQALANEDWEEAAKHMVLRSGSLDKYNKGLRKVSKTIQSMFLNGDYGVKAFGGELGTNGTDFTNGLLEINTGASHEENPHDGVQMGFDQNGVPNLVEEGETVYNNYVFSKRMIVPEFMKKQLGLSGAKKDITFADASKKIAEASKERPNNPMDMAGLEAALGKLAEVQETERMKKQAEEYNDNMAMEEAAQLAQGVPPMTADEEMLAAQQMPMIAACGGKLGKKFEGEGDSPNIMSRWNIGDYGWLSGTFSPSNDTNKYIPYNTSLSKEKVEAREKDKTFIDWTNFVINNWDNPSVQDYLKRLDTAAGGNHLFDKSGKPVAGAQDYFKRQRGLGENGSHKWGYYHLNPTMVADPTQVSQYLLRNGLGETSTTNPTGIREALLRNPVTGDVGVSNVADVTGIRTPDYMQVRPISNLPNVPVNPTTGSQAASTEGEDDTPYTYDTWMRYAPAVGAGIMTLTDALGLTNKPDYTYADKLEAAANAAGYAPEITYKPIGDYMRYNPLDRLFYANQLQANARATDRSMMNTSGGNSGTARAAMIANGYNTNNNLGNLYRQAEEYNLAQREKVADFNRRTNMFNSQMDLEAQTAEARNRQMARQFQMSGLGQAAALRDAIDSRIGASRSANITNLLTSLGNIGRENFAMNQINWDRSRRYEGRLDGTSSYKGGKRTTAGEYVPRSMPLRPISEEILSGGNGTGGFASRDYLELFNPRIPRVALTPIDENTSTSKKKGRRSK